MANSGTVAGGDAAVSSQYNNLRLDVVDGSLNYALATGALSAYNVALPAQLSTYSAGLPVVFKANHTNTGSATLNILGFGAKAIKKNGGNALIGGEIKTNQIIKAIYGGANFELQGNTIVGFGGTGEDGALDTSGGTVDIDLGGLTEVTKNYASINIATNSLTFSNPHASGTIITLKCSGDCVISDTINASGAGATGGAGGAGGTGGAVGAAGTNGTAPYEPIDQGEAYAGYGGLACADPNTAGLSQSTVGEIYNTETRILYANPKRRMIFVTPGAGGAGGAGGASWIAGGGNGGAGGVGGRGGGAFIMEVAGSLNFTGTINCNGVVGTVGTVGAVGGAGRGGGGGGGGSGGAGGMASILYNSQTAISGSITVAGAAGRAGGNGASGTGDGAAGAGGASGAGAYVADGGTGGAGATSSTYIGGTGGSAGGGNGGNASGSQGSTGGGGGGGGGAGNGKSVIAQNLWFT